MNPLNVSFLQELLTSVGERGRALIPSSLFGAERGAGLEALVDALVSGRGEASGVAIAGQLLERYADADEAERLDFFLYLARNLKPDEGGVMRAAQAYVDGPGDERLGALRTAVESPLMEFFRRLNLAPGATAKIVSMRCELLVLMEEHDELARVDEDLIRLLFSWFNRGFLVMKRIDWQTPAAILDKIIAYEAVHEIDGWDDLRRRLEPADRRCFAFFHPSMVDEPLIFVEVALLDDVPSAIEPVLRAGHSAAFDQSATTAVFYSISNCQKGLKGISFGNFLIKQVVEELARDVPTLKTFVTLSPVPRFARWLEQLRAHDVAGVLTGDDRTALKRLGGVWWHAREDEALKSSLVALCAHYFLEARTAAGKLVDPVARFHLGNGAQLLRINWMGDPSLKGLSEGHGLMVNYQYDLREIEKNHEAFANEMTVAASRGVRASLRPLAKSKTVVADVEGLGAEKPDVGCGD